MFRKTAWVVLAALLCLAPASTGATTRTAVFDWYQYKYADSCLAPRLVMQGQANFYVNLFPIPTYTETSVEYADGTGYGHHQAPFNTSLFRIGTNRIEFGVANSAGTPECNHMGNEVYLSGLTADSVLLFDVLMYGTDFSGETELDATLRQIDPDLADSIDDLKQAILDKLAELESLGLDAEEAQRQKERLEKLLEDIEELLERGFDQISIEELESLLAEYADILPDLLDELRQVVEDFKALIEDLRAEIERISGTFRDWAGGLDDFADYAGGFEGDDFEGLGDGGIPDVDVPDVLGDDEFDETHDPYDEYADEVIAQLQLTLDSSGEIVTDRAQFLDIYAAWRINMMALEAGLSSRATVDQAEYGAFLRAQQKVLTFVTDFLDPDGWFRDSPVDQEIRELVDTALMQRNAPKAMRIKAALNLFTELNGSEAATAFAFAFYLRELGLAVQQAQAAVLRAKLVEKEDSLWDSFTGFLGKAASVGWDIAVTLTPVGDLIDICEAVSGKEGCNVFTGRDLTWEERAFAAAGILMVGSTSSIRKLARKLDEIPCRPRAGSMLSIKCNAKAFFNKLDDALENVQKKRPRQDVVSEVKHADGSVTYLKLDGTKVTYNKRGFPEYEPHHMHPTASKPEVWVEFHCKRDMEFRAANQANGWVGDGAPDGFTWHHSHDFKHRNGKVMIKMQLVKEDVHTWSKHAGGIGIGKQILGSAACR